MYAHPINGETTAYQQDIIKYCFNIDAGAEFVMQLIQTNTSEEQLSLLAEFSETVAKKKVEILGAQNAVLSHFEKLGAQARYWNSVDPNDDNPIRKQSFYADFDVADKMPDFITELSFTGRKPLNIDNGYKASLKLSSLEMAETFFDVFDPVFREIYNSDNRISYDDIKQDFDRTVQLISEGKYDTNTIDQEFISLSVLDFEKIEPFINRLNDPDLIKEFRSRIEEEANNIASQSEETVDLYNNSPSSEL